MARQRAILVERIENASHARVPKKATKGSACFDLYAAEETELRIGRVSLVRTGLKIRAPQGTFLEIRPRSGLSTMGVLMVNAPGTIDRDYPLEIKVPLTLLFGRRYRIGTGDRIAQMRLVEEVPTTFRWGKVRHIGERRGGFGSSGR